MDTISQKIFLYVVIVLSAVFHEYAHGWMAYRLGDSTAKNEGRLTLNPLVHLDPIGTVLLPLLLLLSPVGIFMGWAKPVPYNPYNLSDRKYGSLKVGAAGPVANLLIALILGLIVRFYFLSHAGGSSALFGQLLSYVVYINIFLALFNLLPFPPLDGSKVFADLFPRQWQYVMRLGIFGILIAFFIAPYVLIPIAQFIFLAITGARF